MEMSTGNITAHLTPPYLLPKMRMEQERVLEENFRKNRNPTDLDVTLIAAEAGLMDDDVKIWYGHRLACWRQQQGLPANSGSVKD
ncbi:homeodomain-only protein-like [Ylistrum balloti]|uniref:homeodomain-only protein-like n=1 Tax=Ylistrum balloti TaxID=509963 RepID=UPI002905C381|nr:homeodomain-only protein-like [Ylistrum balloti]